MKKHNLVIVGGGSTYTVGIIMNLIKEKDNFPLKKLVLYDIDEERQKLNGEAIRIILEEYYSELEEFHYTTRKELAFANMDFAFVQIRSGGLKMRKLDEQIPLKHGCIGQETTGAGGIAYGLRAIPDMINIVKDIRSYSKECWILNYTNPASIVAEAFRREFPDEKKVLNICDMPIGILGNLASIINLSSEDLVPEYFGLNHFGWFRKIYTKNGDDITEYLIKKVISEGFNYEDSNLIKDSSWIKTYERLRDYLVDVSDYIPNTYMQYYMYSEEIVKNSDINNTRASQVINGREKNIKEFCEDVVTKGKLEDLEMKFGVHGSYIVNLAKSISYNLNDIFIVIVENNGVISNFPKDAMVEVPCIITSNGPKPISIGEIPTFYKGLMENQLAHEKLAVDAYFEKSYRKLIQSLILNRTVNDVNKAKLIANDLIEANKEYWPNLR